MVNYKCKKCYKVFKVKRDYERHLNRKYPCVKNLTGKIKCNYCSKLYQKQGHLNNHLKKYHSAELLKNANSEQLGGYTNKEINELISIVKNLEDKVNELQKERKSSDIVSGDKYDGKKWKLENTNIVIDNLTNDSRDFLEEKFDEFYNSLSKATKTKFKKFLNEADSDVVINRYKNDLKALLYNNRDIVIKTKEMNNKIALIV